MPNGQWEEIFKKLEAYKNEFVQHCLVPRKEGSLGSWVDRQRTQYRSNELEEGKAKALNSIGFDILAGMLAMNRILSVLPNFAMVRHIFYSSVVLAVTTLASLK